MGFCGCNLSLTESKWQIKNLASCCYHNPLTHITSWIADHISTLNTVKPSLENSRGWEWVQLHLPRPNAKLVLTQQQAVCCNSMPGLPGLQGHAIIYSWGLQAWNVSDISLPAWLWVILGLRALSVVMLEPGSVQPGPLHTDWCTHYSNFVLTSATYRRCNVKLFVCNHAVCCYPLLACLILFAFPRDWKIFVTHPSINIFWQERAAG